MKFIHIADVHLGMGFSTASFGLSKGSERRREIKETLMRVIKQCEVDQIGLLFIAGDLFEDDYVHLSELKDINHGFSKLTTTKVVIGAGNHDPIMDHKSPFNLIDWSEQVTLLDTEMSSVTFEEMGVEVYGFSWNKKHLKPFDPSSILPLNSDRHNLLMLHGDVYQENDYLYINPKLIQPLGFDYVALGHIHKRDFIEPWMAYPGSLEPLDFSEGGSHGYIYGELKDHVLTTEFVPFSRRTFHQVSVEIEGTMSFEAIYEAVVASLENKPLEDFYRIRLVGDVDPVVTVDQQLIAQRLMETYYYVEVKDQLQLDLDIERLMKDYEGTLIGAYIEAFMAMDQEDPVTIDGLKVGLRLLLEEQIRL